MGRQPARRVGQPGRARTSPAAPLVMGEQVLVTGARTYLGAVPGTGALIAIVTRGTRARGYLCDGIVGRAVTLADCVRRRGPRRHLGTRISGQHYVRLAAQLGAGAATGTIILPGARVFPFTAVLARGGGQAGLSARPPGSRTG